MCIRDSTQGALSHLYRSHEWTTDAERPKLLMSVGVPDAPRSLTATAGNGQITLNWANTEADGDAIDAASWSVYRGTAAGGEVLLQSGITTNTFTDNTVASGQDYFYYVIATNGSGDSSPSNEVGPVRSLFGPPAPITVTEGIG